MDQMHWRTHADASGRRCRQEVGLHPPAGAAFSGLGQDRIGTPKRWSSEAGAGERRACRRTRFAASGVPDKGGLRLSAGWGTGCTKGPGNSEICSGTAANRRISFRPRASSEGRPGRRVRSSRTRRRSPLQREDSGRSPPPCELAGSAPGQAPTEVVLEVPVGQSLRRQYRSGWGRCS